ncbi:MAG: TldD/PmbA family protein [Myxococcales bacterium]|nr:TldD/PmbA family protein [Myxococcales bacterium]
MSNFFEERFGLDDGVYRRVMATALERGGEYCDLYFQQRSSTVLGLEDEEINRAFRSDDLGVGIRVVRGDATGYAFSEDLEEASMHAAARVAAAIASGGQSEPPQKIVSRTHPDLYPVERPWGEVSTVERLPLLGRVNARAAGGDDRISKVRVHLSDSESRVLVVDAEGRKSYDYQPMTTLYVACVARDGERREESYHNIGGRQGLELYTDDKLDHVADEAVRRTLLLFDARRPPAGEMPVVLAAGSSGILLHEAIGHGMEADFNRKGTSIYSDRLGKLIAEPIVSIVDDGTLPASRGAINVDDEGNETQRTVLVENGVLRTYLHDRISARHYGVKPTGNGRRQSFRHVPMPRMRATYMLPGPHDREEIIRSVKQGILAESFTNGQVQIGAGDFTFYIKCGYLIEDGRITAPIKDVNIIGNGPKVLADVTMVADDMVIDEGGWTCGKDGQSVPVSLGMPTVKVGSVTVGGVS